MIIGRNAERKELKQVYESEYSEFVAITGRRRIGKTFLVREVFNYTFAFQHSGLAGMKTKRQLKEFQNSLIKYGMKKCRVPVDWFDAFTLLSELLDSKGEGKKVVFIDELPWMDAPRSSLVPALEHFWNGYASARKDILFIICGSATSWIIDKVYRNHGGLHNRVSHQIYLNPFTLNECEQFANNMNLGMSRNDIMECYMVMGGVPYYWSLLKRGLSVPQNIDALFFSRMGKLRYEYRELYDSLFKKPDIYIEVVSILSQKKIGMTRDEIVKSGNIPSGGGISKVLADLESCGLIRRYTSLDDNHSKNIYQLTDHYTLFYYKFQAGKNDFDENFWSSIDNTPTFNAWKGLAFERLCFSHIKQIKEALGIAGVTTNVYSWRTGDDPVYGSGAQIDMVIDRADRVVNLCEMKFSTKEFAIDKECDDDLRHKQGRFVETTKTNKTTHITLITPYGIKENTYQFTPQKVITAEDLFEP